MVSQYHQGRKLCLKFRKCTKKSVQVKVIHSGNGTSTTRPVLGTSNSGSVVILNRPQHPFGEPPHIPPLPSGGIGGSTPCGTGTALKLDDRVVGSAVLMRRRYISGTLLTALTKCLPSVTRDAKYRRRILISSRVGSTFDAAPL